MTELAYRLKRQTERFGSITLEIECLEDLNATIDDLFGQIEVTQDTSLLEDLCPYFGVIWPSARALAEHMIVLGEQGFRSKRILELGCGLAIPSMIAAKLGGQVTASDFHPEVPGLLERNLRLNDLASVSFERLDWKQEESRLGRFDWVVGSDILYEKYHPRPVAQAFAGFLAPQARFLLADPGRPYLQAFADELAGLGFAVSTHVLEPGLKDVGAEARKEIFLLAGNRP